MKLSRALRGGLMAAFTALQPAWALAGPLIPEPFSATVNTEVYGRYIGGDTSRSFLTDGTFKKTDLDFFYNRPSEKGPTVTGQLSFQEADDPIIVGHQDHFRLRGGFLALEKEQYYRLEAGYIIPKASRATLTATLLGLGGYYQINGPGRVTRLNLIGGQINPPVEGSRFQRGVVGGTLTEMFAGDAGSLKLHGNLYRIEDLESSIQHRLGLSRLSSYVYSAGADLSHRTGLGLGWESAFTDADPGSNVRAAGSSLRLSPTFSGDYIYAAANYERNSPRFINPVGGIAPDLKRVDGSVTVGRTNQLSLSSLYTQNNVEGQFASTTKTQYTGLSAKWVPLESSEIWKPLSISPDYSLSRSVVTGGVSDTESRQVGVSFAYVTTGINASLRGEYSPLRDYVNPANNRDIYKAYWQMGLRFVNPQAKLNFAPKWSLSLERNRSASSGLSDPALSALVGFTGGYSDTFTCGLTHEFQQKKTLFNDHRVKNESTRADLGLLIKTRAPIRLALSYSRKHYFDSLANSFAENELRGTVNVRF